MKITGRITEWKSTRLPSVGNQYLLEISGILDRPGLPHSQVELELVTDGLLSAFERVEIVLEPIPRKETKL